MQPAMTIDEPVATGWLRSEFYGDSDKGQAYLYAARKQLGALKTRYGVNARVAMGEPGGFYRDIRTLPDGTQIETFTNDGHDTVRITVPTSQSFSASTSVGEGESTSFQGQGESTEFTPQWPVEQPTIKPVYDQPMIEYALWILRYGAIPSLVLEEWDFDNGYTGQTVDLPAGADQIQGGFLIFAGYVWGVVVSDIGTGENSIFRVDLQTKVREVLYVKEDGFPGNIIVASTVTPQGVLFALGTYRGLSFILINEDGTLVYDTAVPLRNEVNTIRYSARSFINDGKQAFLHQGDGSAIAEGVTIVEISTGESYTIGTHGATPGSFAEEGAPPNEDYRGSGLAILSGDTLYEATTEFELPNTINFDIRQRDPSASNPSVVLAQIAQYSPTVTDAFRISAAAVENGPLVFFTAMQSVVIDTVSKSIVSTAVAPFSDPNKGTSIIPGSNSVAFLRLIVDQFFVPAPMFAMYDPVTGELDQYALKPLTALGYLVQYTITPAANPDPDSPPAPEEWEYLSQTNVNPI